MTPYKTLPEANRAAHVAQTHIRMTREYLEYRVRELESARDRAEYRLEEAQNALSTFEAKAAMAEKVVGK